MIILHTIALYVLTALAEIVGCYLPWMVLKQGKTPWLLLPLRSIAGLVRLAADVSPERRWPDLCRLWRGLCRHRPTLAASSGWRYINEMGRARRSHYIGGHGHHCFSAAHQMTHRWRRTKSLDHSWQTSHRVNRTLVDSETDEYLARKFDKEDASLLGS